MRPTALYAVPNAKEMAQHHLRALTVVQDNLIGHVGRNPLTEKAARHAQKAREALEQYLKTL